MIRRHKTKTKQVPLDNLAKSHFDSIFAFSASLLLQDISDAQLSSDIHQFVLDVRSRLRGEFNDPSFRVPKSNLNYTRTRLSKLKSTGNGTIPVSMDYLNSIIHEYEIELQEKSHLYTELSDSYSRQKIELKHLEQQHEFLLETLQKWSISIKKMLNDSHISDSQKSTLNLFISSFIKTLFHEDLVAQILVTSQENEHEHENQTSPHDIPTGKSLSESETIRRNTNLFDILDQSVVPNENLPILLDCGESPQTVDIVKKLSALLKKQNFNLGAK